MPKFTGAEADPPAASLGGLPRGRQQRQLSRDLLLPLWSWVGACAALWGKGPASAGPLCLGGQASWEEGGNPVFLPRSKFVSL